MPPPLPLELEYMILDYTTFLEFSTLRKVCRTWDEYLINKHYGSWYAPMRALIRILCTDLSPNGVKYQDTGIELHRLLEAGGICFMITILPGGNWSIDYYFLKLSKFLDAIKDMSIDEYRDCITKIILSKQPSYLGYRLSKISTTRYGLGRLGILLPDEPPIPVHEQDILAVQFNKLPCQDDYLFHPKDQNSQRLFLSLSNEMAGTSLVSFDNEESLEYMTLPEDTVYKWNSIYSKVAQRWTFRMVAEKYAEFLVRELWSAISRMEGVDDPYKFLENNGRTRLFVEFPAFGCATEGCVHQNKFVNELEISICTEFTIWNRSGVSH
ncbi:hypothetical protein ABW19_dt0204671 [Dactylella cylindrospora]|nr:hypothetical protein ABW19_dt0204671 [Dactylella cylindrospora]